MRRAMAHAPVGDDQFGEDPSVNRLQELVAEMLGKDAALFVPSGHMANQLALKLYTRPGDDVIVGRESHAVWHESGAGAANSGVQFTEIGDGGVFTAKEFLAARKPRGHMIFPPTTLVEVENTHNRAGGVIFPAAELEKIGAAARELDVASYLDGARLLNAAIARGDKPAALAAPFDLVAISLSKGLGAPGGSVLAGRREDTDALVRYRRMLGGAMRQVGILAAAGIFALERNVERLAEDHVNARLLAERLARSPRILIDLDRVETNIVVFQLAEGAPDAATVVARAAEHGVLVFAFGARTVRAVTHLDVDGEACQRGADILVDVVESSPL
jgi:threonine aldolase